jgi:hypothetical protein
LSTCLETWAEFAGAALRWLRRSELVRLASRSLIFSAIHFRPRDQRIARRSISSVSARQSPIRRQRSFGRRFEAGIWLSAVTRRSKICPGCSTRSYGVGAIIPRRSTRRCDNWIANWPFGPNGNTRSCAVIYAERHTGSHGFLGALRKCSACLLDGSRMSREAQVRFCESLGVGLPRATHPVICCRGRAEEALARMRDIMAKLKLTVNVTKTRVCKLPEKKSDFLGYMFGRSAENRACIHRHGSFEEAGDPHLRDD